MNNASWSQEAYLKASNTAGQDLFGRSVAVSGDRVLVGAHGEDGGAGGVNGDQGDNSARAAGAAYAFTRNGMTWTQQAYLKASNPDIDDYFGWAVAISVRHGACRSVGGVEQCHRGERRPER